MSYVGGRGSRTGLLALKCFSDRNSTPMMEKYMRMIFGGCFSALTNNHKLWNS